MVTGFHAHVDPERIGRTVRAFVRLTASTATTRSVAAAEEIGREHPAVQEVFLLLGDAEVGTKIVEIDGKGGQLIQLFLQEHFTDTVKRWV